MKNVRIILRINSLEKGEIKKRADKAGMTLSEYIRFIALNGVVRK
jgi:predicted DNA binding CopG/RHH family protein